VRYDRFVSRRDSVYALAGAFADRFAGYDWRANGQVGMAHAFVSVPTTTLRGELGRDVAREDFVDGVSPNAQTVLSARALVGARHAFNTHVAIENNLELYQSLLAFDDLRVNNTLAVTASVDKRVALKLSHRLSFDNVPVEGYQPLDHTTLATVVFTVL
jgi:putative salt-induced outer membrane protein YdiY